MPFKKFDEYMNAKGKVVEKPVVDPSADYKGPQDKAPEKEGDWVIKNGKTPKIPGVGQKKLGDYANSSQKPWKQKDVPNGGIAEAPAKKLFKEPKDAYPKGSSKKPWVMKSKETKTEEFVNKTSNMSLSEFTKYMLSECTCEDEKENSEDGEIPHVTAFAAGKFHPHPPEVIKYITHLAKKNPRILDSLVHELNRAGILPDTIKAGMDRPEGIEGLASIFSDEEKGPKHARALTRAFDDQFNKFQDEQDDLYESVAGPYAGYDEDEPEKSNSDDSESVPSLNVPSMSPDEDGGEDNADDTDHHDEPEEGPPSQDSHIDKSTDNEEKPKKLKKKFGHDHILDSFSSVGHIKEKMKNY